MKDSPMMTIQITHKSSQMCSGELTLSVYAMGLVWLFLSIHALRCVLLQSPSCKRHENSVYSTPLPNHPPTHWCMCAFLLTLHVFFIAHLRIMQGALPATATGNINNYVHNSSDHLSANFHLVALRMFFCFSRHGVAWHRMAHVFTVVMVRGLETR